MYWLQGYSRCAALGQSGRQHPAGMPYHAGQQDGGRGLVSSPHQAHGHVATMHTATFQTLPRLDRAGLGFGASGEQMQLIPATQGMRGCAAPMSPVPVLYSTQGSACGSAYLAAQQLSARMSAACVQHGGAAADACAPPPPAGPARTVGKQRAWIPAESPTRAPKGAPNTHLHTEHLTMVAGVDTSTARR
jgi:hypothetical protein